MAFILLMVDIIGLSGLRLFRLSRLGLGALALCGLGACSKIGEEPKTKGPVKELPLAEYRDSTTLDMYEGSHKSWLLKTKHLVKWPRTDLVRARPVDLTVYDTLGAPLFRVTSDSGTVDEGISFLVASGHVHGHSTKGVDITSDSLRWNKAINQISTEARVRVISEEGDVLTGKGFLSDAKLDNWQILSDVKGVFQKVEKRIQDAEKDTTQAGKSVAKPDSGNTLPVNGGIPPPATDSGKHSDTAKASGTVH
ncbi:MAG: LPS export ABC transporter periplasmic protein LptC [Fibrobacteria bacterium]